MPGFDGPVRLKGCCLTAAIKAAMAEIQRGLNAAFVANAPCDGPHRNINSFLSRSHSGIAGDCAKPATCGLLPLVDGAARLDGSCMNGRFCTSEARAEHLQRIHTFRPWCCSLHCGMSIEPCLSSCYNVFRFQAQLTERDRRRSEFSACEKLIKDQRLTSSAPNRRSHQVQRISPMRDRFSAFWHQGWCSDSPA